jgi:hypothetical protein
MLGHPKDVRFRAKVRTNSPTFHVAARPAMRPPTRAKSPNLDTQERANLAHRAFTDVHPKSGMKPKSASFRHISTALAEEKAVGGRNWAGGVFEVL